MSDSDDLVLSTNLTHGDYPIDVFIVLTITPNILEDELHGQSSAHIAEKLWLVVCALIGIAIVGKQFMDHIHRNLIALKHDLQQARI